MYKKNFLNDYINRNSTYLLISFIVLFAFYIQIYGEDGPGGGFQGGILLACVFLLHSLIFGYQETLQVISLKFLRICCAVGVLVYFSTGCYALFFNKNFLNYNVIATDNIHLSQKIGVFLVEIGVGTTIFSAMLLIFFSFSIFVHNKI